MSKHCPLYGVAIYMDCLECENKICRKGKGNNMIKWIYAKEGCKFIPTDKADNRIKAKYDVENSPKSIINQYKHSAPESWVKNGYVIEVRE